MDIGKDLQDAFTDGYNCRDAEIIRCKYCEHYKCGYCGFWLSWLDDDNWFCSQGKIKGKN